MIAPLNQELVATLHSVGDGELEVVDPDSITDAMEALHLRETRDAIAEGLAQMEAGNGQPLDVAFKGMRSQLGFAQPVFRSP